MIELSKKTCFVHIQLYPDTIQEFLSSAPIVRISIDQTHPLEDPSLCFLPVPTPGLHIPPSLQVDPFPRTSLTDPTAVELPALDILRVPSQIPLECFPGRPPRHRAAYGTPRTDDDVDPAVRIGVPGVRVGFQVGGFGGAVGVLPYDEGFVQGVEAVTGEGGGVVDGERLLVAFGV